MNLKSLSAIALVAAFAGNAFAESPGIDDRNFVSTKSRADVQAELVAYKKAGVNPHSISYNPIAHFRSTASRDAVVAEYIAVRDEVAALTSEDGGSSFALAYRGPANLQIAGQ